MTNNNDHEIFSKHAKTFSLAACLFKKEDRSDVVAFYAFCRAIDDCVDLSDNPAESRLRLKTIAKEIESGDLISFPAMGEVMFRKKISPYYLLRLLYTLESDLNLTSLKDIDELQNYCLGVASTVGVVLCKILGPLPLAAIPHAIDLGIAMQMTNIARDVHEDALAGKIFLPTSFFPEGFLPEAHDERYKAIIENYGSLPVIAARRRLIELTDKYYRSAEQGYSFLPLRARLAIAAAARMYEAIGTACAADWTKHRAYVSPWKKIRSASGGIGFALTPPKAEVPVHSTLFYEEMIAHYDPI